MKAIINIPSKHVQYFTDLAGILESDWQSLFEKHLETLEFSEMGSRGDAAFAAMLRADSSNEARRIASRAIEFMESQNLTPPHYEDLILHYQHFAGEIDAEELALLGTASQLIDGSMAPAPLITTQTEDNEGEEWKEA
jgi:hypothetical protein